MTSINRANAPADSFRRNGADGSVRAPENGPSVAFVGFDTTDEARRAAGAAIDALRPWLARQRRTSFVAGPRRLLEAERHDRGSRLTLRGIPIGRIIEPAGPGHPDGYGFELMLPPGTGRSTSVGAARVVVDALATHGEARSYERSP